MRVGIIIGLCLLLAACGESEEVTRAKWMAYCTANDFKKVQVGDKLFSILETPPGIIQNFYEEGFELILTFIREAYDGFDDLPRIHADNIINGQKTALAKVLYINDTDGVTKMELLFGNITNTVIFFQKMLPIKSLID